MPGETPSDRPCRIHPHEQARVVFYLFKCHGCGQTYKAGRFDAFVCSSRCQKRIKRHGSQAYLKTLPGNQRRERRAFRRQALERIADYEDRQDAIKERDHRRCARQLRWDNAKPDYDELERLA